MGWKTIDTAPKDIVSRRQYSEALTHEYGPYIIAWPVFGEVARVRWWQAEETPKSNRPSCNFLEDGGNAVRPTHWRKMPAPPRDAR